MSKSYHFDGTEDLESERLRICQFLSDIDAPNAKRYSSEINDITERTIIRRGMRQIEESKIYVDDNGIKSRGRKLFQEMFDRLQAFAAISKSTPELKITDSVKLLSYFEVDDKGQLVQKPVPEDNTSTEAIKVLHIAHIGYFKDLFLEVRDRFISSGEHGLDAYLSTRVRHGTLEGHVRSIFERLHLIAQRDKVAGGYSEVSFWNDKIGTGNAAILKDIQSSIADFSRTVDRTIDHLKRNVVQVCTERRREDGWLDFSYSDAELIQLLTEKFASLNTYDEYISEILRALWARTNLVLEKTRRSISGEIKSQVYDALLSLLQDIRQKVRAESAPELHGNLTRGLTNLQTEFDRIAKWFTVSHTSLVEEFKMSDVVQICVASINNTYPSAPISPEITILDEHVYQGGYFAHFNDIFRTLFDNVKMHSGLSGSSATMNVEVKTEGDGLCIVVKNPLSEDARRKDPVVLLQEKLRSLRERETQQKLVKTEGGSGIAKIYKILHSDLSRHRVDLEFSYSDDNQLKVEVVMELNGLTTTYL